MNTQRANQYEIPRHFTTRRAVECVEDLLSRALAFPANPDQDIDPPRLNLPKSFLDYAWTSPTPPAMSAPNPSKTSRKQNRCCDQCRKGKRACDAAILEDSLLDASKSGDHPSVFHYSDVYGPLAACGNCEKTKKSCTFEWLRSQRVSQATQAPPNPVPPAKRRRTDSNAAIPLRNTNGSSRQVQIGKPICRSDITGSGSLMSPAQLGVTFGDFPGVPALQMDSSTNAFRSIPALWYDSIDMSAKEQLGHFSDVFEDGASQLTCDSGQGSSLETPPGSVKDTIEERGHRPSNGDAVDDGETAPKVDGAIMRAGRKRRRRSSSVSLSNGALPCPAISFAAEFVSSANKAFLREGLLKIYHDSFENALSCWLTERTCPYTAKADISLTNDGRPDWNRMYHRVFRLDRLASSIRGRQLTFQEDKAVGKALNSAIFSFATQWAQSSERSRAKYPFDHGANSEGFTSQSADMSLSGIEFDRTLQITAWNEARVALQDAGDIESFRLVLAQIVFSLTQRRNDPDTELGMASDQVELERSAFNIGDAGVEEYEDLMARLNLAIDAEDPPVHLEKGVRLIHSLRSRMTMRAGTPLLKPRANRRGKQYRPAANRVDAADRATVDLLFWLGVMFDTLSSAMHKRPLVLSDEDSNVYANEPRTTADQMQRDVGSIVPRSTEGVWDIHLFAHQRTRLQQKLVRWPCSFEQAAALLCDAAPVKVLLFRKVTRIQTLLSRSCHGERVERSIKAALSVCEHWERLYAPFIRDCVQYHDTLPPRIQSWYICLTGHWHLATLLLADLIEIVDDSEFGLETQQMLRTSTDFVACFRKSNCQALSDLARCSCPRENASFAQSRDFHFAVNQGALLTEPWTAVLIRAFAKAGVVLLETGHMLPSFSVDGSSGAEEAFQRAEDCVQALWYLGRKSDMALSAAKILGDALKQKRKGAEEKLKEMSSYLEVEMWQGFDQLDKSAAWDCSM
ncbi:hypothetical protein BU25DRAFT_470993 [Macroventuria anomochaeta]|uniref:Uncharacterized protein n=1 Tax=Macroventuria anomochaeta TaxID=301207 RepID=A0ACB6SFW6_9PLEO|nr:uncharacterized protein BU25DRAFT_470993 [Macroventuria anomochaeta]KAF2632929.1 hypothetical protein BU25DRAFT_470993 [Macroventuria anomochaeta]